MPVICEASFGKLVSSSLYWGFGRLENFCSIDDEALVFKI